MNYRREWARKRYAEDPDYRRRRLQSGRAYRAAHKAEINERLRRKRATDPEYRERRRARCRGARGRRNMLKTHYGMSLEDYDALLARQKFACAICKKRTEQPLCVDHCHSSGVVRGLLCNKCNVGLGCYGDEPNLTLAATLYLMASRIARARNTPGLGARALPRDDGHSPTRDTPGPLAATEAPHRPTEDDEHDERERPMESAGRKIS